ncbi:hypothetical protein H6G54_23890 [Anabaena cylindrica FACHB-243]|uniref:Uncharacterized protein n=1 Tax=Anabaena cylindrica (strain ATCC 27899 / PCC 7122) TaxID=272123 RepID=K9ZJL3_ANACC|nr:MULTISPECIES: hypothetical protein [Anabaena]AFZ58964.1 hypothetical protein Anacy_3569 [Anabaena cylindrica PCC 7122]MBD2420691.1 hypothetical protein [Anabaena cylindrica FACHB-243]MBY5281183.1 hypothetical protein [Anabaena sp. CCAP 1446/1C]MBY5306681.1 hypothetical protein [Anabaena sp. CCAP 1446/1C]MCM2408415.1 hypothetical protein [Anabaena sp. CCAP 1446/1C]
MTPKIQPTAHPQVKGLILTLLLSVLMAETAQAQSIPSINIPTIKVLDISVIRPSINIPKPTIKIEIPSVIKPQDNIFKQPTNFVINGAANNTRPSFISVIQDGINIPQIQTGIGQTTVIENTKINTTINIPTATTTLSTINVVVPSTNIVDPGNINFNVTTTPISDQGSVMNSVNLSLPLPILD